MATPFPNPSAAPTPRDQALAAGHLTTQVVAVAFGLVAALRIAQIVGLFLPPPGSVVPPLFLPITLASGVATISLVVWLGQAANIARDHMSRPFKFTPGDAAISLIIPVLNLIQPYRVVTALAANADPSDLPPVREVRVNPNAGYREPAIVITESKPVLPSVPLALWWAMWIASSTLGVLIIVEVWGATLCHLMAIAAAGLTVVIVRGVDARRLERGRRMAAMEREERAA